MLRKRQKSYIAKLVRIFSLTVIGEKSFIVKNVPKNMNS